MRNPHHLNVIHVRERKTLQQFLHDVSDTALFDQIVGRGPLEQISHIFSRNKTNFVPLEQRHIFIRPWLNYIFERNWCCVPHKVSMGPTAPSDDHKNGLFGLAAGIMLEVKMLLFPSPPPDVVLAQGSLAVT